MTFRSTITKDNIKELIYTEIFRVCREYNVALDAIGAVIVPYEGYQALRQCDYLNNATYYRLPRGQPILTFQGICVYCGSVDEIVCVYSQEGMFIAKKEFEETEE